MRWLTLSAAALLAWPVLAAPLTVTDAWVREPIPGRMMSAAFMQLQNDGSAEKVLVSARADWAGLIEIHTHMNDNGVMRMRQLESLPVPAGQRLALQPGGYHLMLFRLQLPLQAPLALELCFADGECQTVTAEIRGIDGHGKDNHHGH